MTMGGGAVVRKEPGAPLATIPALVGGVAFLFFSVQTIRTRHEAPERARQNEELRVAGEARWQLTKDAAGAFKDAFLATPALAGSMEFWSQPGLARPMAELGLNWALQEKGFVMPPGTRDYVVEHLPSCRGILIGYGHFAYEKLPVFFLDEKQAYDVRDAAMNKYLRDERTRIEDLELPFVLREFGAKASLVLARASDEQLAQFVSSSDYPEWFRRNAAESQRIRAMIKPALVK